MIYAHAINNFNKVFLCYTPRGRVNPLKIARGPRSKARPRQGSHSRVIIRQRYLHGLLAGVRGCRLRVVPDVFQVRPLFTIAANAAAPVTDTFGTNKPLGVVIVTRKISVPREASHSAAINFRTSGGRAPGKHFCEILFYAPGYTRFAKTRARARAREKFAFSATVT